MTEALRYWLRRPLQGRSFKALRDLAADGVDVPSLRNVPVIKPPYRWLWAAFCHLSEKRPERGAGLPGIPQYIPASEILAYAVLADIRSPGRRTLLLRIVSALDSIYMAHTLEQLAKTRPRG